MPYSSIERSLLATISYSDIFDYPLTAAEIQYWLIGQPCTDKKIQALLKMLTGISDAERYYFLSGRKRIAVTRIAREKYSEHKWRLAQSMANRLKIIGDILLIGVTGGLSLMNADRDDDIDLFFIVRSGTLYTSRLLATLLCEAGGVRRHPTETEVKDSFCLNMFIDESGLGVPRQERDLYSAHEVLQMRPLWIRENVYRRFLTANSWVRDVLPNAFMQTLMTAPYGYPPFQNTEKTDSFLERLLSVAERLYMMRRRTTEIVTDHILRFHPKDIRRSVIAEFDKRMYQVGVPLDKKKYCRIK